MANPLETRANNSSRVWVIGSGLARDTITFRNNDAQTALPMREMGAFKPGEMVGGTAAHWGGNARRFLPHDFEIHSRIKERYGASFIPEDCHLQDWASPGTRSNRTTTSSSISLASAVRPAT